MGMDLTLYAVHNKIKKLYDDVDKNFEKYNELFNKKINKLISKIEKNSMLII